MSALPPASKLVQGVPRGAVGRPDAPPRNTDTDVWAADTHLTPNGKFLYVSERTGSTLAAFSVDGASGKPAYCRPRPQSASGADSPSIRRAASRSRPEKDRKRSRFMPTACDTLDALIESGEIDGGEGLLVREHSASPVPWIGRGKFLLPWEIERYLQRADTIGRLVAS